jgi:F-type H+-transporting ATPase subunit b
MTVELDWSTFLLEIVNVLVLVWLLKRFLYRPVMTVIEERKSAIAKTVADASRLQNEASALKEQYDRRLVGWEQEREKARVQLQEEIAAERQRRVAALQADLEKERQQATVRESQRIKDVARQAEALALSQGSQFTASLLSRVAGPELETKLIGAMMEDWSRLPQHQVDAIRSALPANARGRVTTAFLLEQGSREALVKKVEGRLDRTFEWEFSEDRNLLAGLRVSLGGWVLRGNLQDELKFFAEGETGGA